MKPNMRAPSRWLLSRRWLGHPLLAAVLALVGASDAYLVADQHPSSPAGRVLAWARGDSDGDCGCRETLCCIYDGPKGLRLLGDGYDDPRVNAMNEDERKHLYAVDPQDDDTCIGLLAPWWQRHALRLVTADHEDNPAPRAVDDFVRKYVRAAMLQDTPEYNVCYQSDADPLTLDSFFWNLRAWGIAHDAVMVPLDLLALLGIVRIPAYLRRRRHEARQARSLCTKCRYPVAGLPSDAGVCPECGQRIENSGPILAPA
ncbi:MAG: hypothetical protein GC200_05220 [Tepidisphaera sp.]|nr:hypothetical protein [Tepidisphaera sp.]